ALGISNAKQALNAQKKVSELTNEMLKKNSETLKQGSIDIAKESERAIVDLETLKKTNSDLITTLDEIVKIHAEGRKQREEAEVELNKIEIELKDKLMNLKEENA
ncbi:MAG: toxic anion resistance protein, partial [Bacilli bacterium]|nr:toxic anion resistance protein [Bacilli bacterium]